MPSTKNNVRNIQWLIWFCLFWVLFFYILESYPASDALNYAFNTTAAYAIIIYTSALYLIPQFYRKKKYGIFIVSVVLLLLLVTVIRVNAQNYIWYNLINHSPHSLKPRDYYYTFISHCIIFVDSIILRFALDYFKIREQQQQLLKQNAETRYDLLKAQVHPHFLFNTLNNIYYVAQRESPHTADLLQKLSAIMRYFIDQESKAKVPLTDEIEFIHHYIHLENLRLRYPVKKDFRIKGDPAGTQIPPMLLIPLVENVFKHGIDHNRDNNFITVSLTLTGRLNFEVRNQVGETVGLAHPASSGLGLKNLQQRLEILYPSGFTLDSTREGNTFISSLNIPI
jgi:sensor histidine kinase YesM